jgi:hypothetical protein
VLLSLLATIAAWRGDGTEAWLSVGADDAAKVAARPRPPAPPLLRSSRPSSREPPRGEREREYWITNESLWEPGGKKKESKKKRKRRKKKEEKKEKGKKKGIILFIFKNYDSQILICLLLLQNEK